MPWRPWQRTRRHPSLSHLYLLILTPEEGKECVYRWVLGRGLLNWPILPRFDRKDVFAIWQMRSSKENLPRGEKKSHFLYRWVWDLTQAPILTGLRISISQPHRGNLRVQQTVCNDFLRHRLLYQGKDQQCLNPLFTNYSWALKRHFTVIPSPPLSFA